MELSPEWIASDGRGCAACGTIVAVVAEDGDCPLCWATRTNSDPDRALGQAIAVEALQALDTAPEQVANCVRRLRRLSEVATRPAVTAVLSQAARDLELLAESI